MNPSNDFMAVAFSELKQRVIRLEAWQREHDEAIEARLRDRDKKKLIAQGMREAHAMATHGRQRGYTTDYVLATIVVEADKLDPP